MFKRIKETKDMGFVLMVALIAAVVAWVLLTPLVSSIASSSLNRFHLRSQSFAWWSIQQPIPTMYNFANRYEVSEIPPGFIDPLFFELGERRHINHFPVRVFTFADGRYQYLKDGTDRWLTVESTYRDQKLESRFHAQPTGDGGFELIRLPDQEQGW